MLSKIMKALRLVRYPRARTALLKDRVAATTEHFGVIRQVAPASLIDIGANKGQFSVAVRTFAPTAEIHAFEPLPSAQARFASVFRGDARTTLHPFAIAAEEGTTDLHVGSREDSSSLLPIAEAETIAYGVRASGTIAVETRRLASVIDVSSLPRPILLKIDVQGAELEVLKGITDFSAIDFIYIELSFVELYVGQPLFDEVYEFLRRSGYRLRGLFNLSSTEAYGATQVDVLFDRQKPD